MLIIKYLKCFGLKDSGFFKDLCLSKRIDKIWHIKVCNLTPKQPHNCLKSNILFYFSSKGTYATWDLYLGIHQNWTCHQCSLPPQEWQLVCLCRYQDCQNVRKWFLKIFTDYTSIIYLFIECKLYAVIEFCSCSSLLVIIRFMLRPRLPYVLPVHSFKENMGLDFLGITSTYPVVWITTKSENIHKSLWKHTALPFQQKGLHNK